MRFGALFEEDPVIEGPAALAHEIFLSHEMSHAAPQDLGGPDGLRTPHTYGGPDTDGWPKADQVERDLGDAGWKNTSHVGSTRSFRHPDYPDHYITLGRIRVGDAHGVYGQINRIESR